MKIDLLLDKLKDVKVSRVDDFVDRLNYMWTTFVLAFFTLGIGLQQTFKSALNCKPDANFAGSWVEYTNNYCYVNGTYQEEFDGEKKGYTLSYYQWVPYILAAQALSFYLPHWVYLTASKFVSNLNVRAIVDRCFDVSEKKQDEVDKEMKDVAKVVYSYTTLPHEVIKNGLGRPLGRGLTVLYLFCKLLNVLNILVNLTIFVRLVGQGNWTWAFDVVNMAFTGNYVQDNEGYFPRVTFCDIVFKMTGQSHRRKVQCLLMINILAEKVFVFLHFWFLAVLVLTLLNFFYSVYEIFLVPHNRAEVLSAPFFDDHSKGKRNPYRLKSHRNFYKNYLGLNGNLMIRFVEEHAGSLVASKFVGELVKLWRGDDEQEELSSVETTLTLKSGMLVPKEGNQNNPEAA